ncbi:ATP-dependent helicase HrpB [Flaviflexus salsibiostraticola]|uniref:ATP-dependent helicase HrpB n=2 Tax=Flaviflexus salsibiostraticola TaxID=1282737 RepID=A0A3S8ZCC2_9ACTO|nr:ATP-dependent helicase HrpB [Flaviflexus salsibiostraticola]
MFELDLPVGAALPELGRAMEDVGAAVLSAPPGSGKTTLVPPYLASITEGTILVSQPRRMAARAAARRLAGLLGEKVGESVGYSVRGDTKRSRATRIEFVTAGVLLRRILADPDLDGVGAVVLDEVHERHLDSDLSAALLLDIRDLTGLRLVAMSATLAADVWARLLDAPIVEAHARTFPVDVLHRPGPAPLGVRGVERDFLAHVAAEVRLAADEQEGSVLVFLPGRREIETVAGMLDRRVRVLHGSVPAREQDEILAGGPQQQIVLATSIAESSLTVPGVTQVVDSGLAREPRTRYQSGITGLVTVFESKAGAAQRAGRAGRLGPGTARILMSQTSWSRLADYPEPEIRTADLTDFLLSALRWGDPSDLRLPDPPPEPALRSAEQILRRLGAIDGGITEFGRRISAIPAHPRTSVALLRLYDRIGTRRAAEIIALLEEDQPVPGADLAAAWRDMVRRPTPSWRQSVRRLSGLVPDAAGSPVTADEAVGEVVAAAYPDRIAVLRSGTYLTAAGTGAVLPQGSPLTGSEWLAIADLADSGRADAMIRSAIPISRDLASDMGGIEETLHEIAGRRVRAWRVRRLGAIELNRWPADIDPDAARPLLIRSLPDLLSWSDSALHLRQRLDFLHRTLGAPWPDVSDEGLSDRAEEWLGPELDRWSRGGAIQADLVDCLRRLLPWPEAVDLERLAPARIESPAGGTAKIHYDAEKPYSAMKVQECFGWQDSPLLAGGVRLQIQLLSPAARPLAVTDDLASFWRGAYSQVRAENRGRYPKHPWPEDPLSATPTRKTTRRAT